MSRAEEFFSSAEFKEWQERFKEWAWWFRNGKSCENSQDKSILESILQIIWFVFGGFPLGGNVLSLRPGVTAEQIRAAFTVAFQTFKERHPELSDALIVWAVTNAISVFGVRTHPGCDANTRDEYWLGFPIDTGSRMAIEALFKVYNEGITQTFFETLCTHGEKHAPFILVDDSHDSKPLLYLPWLRLIFNSESPEAICATLRFVNENFAGNIFGGTRLASIDITKTTLTERDICTLIDSPTALVGLGGVEDKKPSSMTRAQTVLDSAAYEKALSVAVPQESERSDRDWLKSFQREFMRGASTLDHRLAYRSAVAEAAEQMPEVAPNLIVWAVMKAIAIFEHLSNPIDGECAEAYGLELPPEMAPRQALELLHKVYQLGVTQTFFTALYNEGEYHNPFGAADSRLNISWVGLVLVSEERESVLDALRYVIQNFGADKEVHLSFVDISNTPLHETDVEQLMVDGEALRLYDGVRDSKVN